MYINKFIHDLPDICIALHAYMNLYRPCMHDIYINMTHTVAFANLNAS